jgi:hypothetical protein
MLYIGAVSSEIDTIRRAERSLGRALLSDQNVPGERTPARCDGDFLTIVSGSLLLEFNFDMGVVLYECNENLETAEEFQRLL